MGEVAEIYSNKIDIKVHNEYIPVEMTEEMISKLLLNNQIGIKGRAIMREISGSKGAEEIVIICDELKILDRRGKKSGN
jgi:hypothetical protein